MTRDGDRIASIRDALGAAGLDGLACALPADVLLLSGYWPVVGTSLAVAARDGRVALLVPEDEKDLASQGWADEVRTFRPGALTELRTAAEAVREPLADTARSLGLSGRRVGYEAGPTYEPSSYASMHLYDASITRLLHEAMEPAALVQADDLLADLRGRKTPAEVEGIRQACRIAGQAFLEGASRLTAGLKETEAANFFRGPLSAVGVGFEDVRRADGFAWCMSGPNAALAHAAYARSRDRRLQAGDFVMIHCNSYADGRWTDITRTFHLGSPDDRAASLYDAVFAARAAALSVIRPGARAADVDEASRDVLRSRGLGEAFKHSTGHGVGFAAIDHNARPRLHPRSDEVLRLGMVFNVEPAVYFDGYGGLRHCDVVAVTDAGATVLTPFLGNSGELTVSAGPSRARNVAE
jgi:Xaa-Pro aminopeptidase